MKFCSASSTSSHVPPTFDTINNTNRPPKRHSNDAAVWAVTATAKQSGTSSSVTHLSAELFELNFNTNALSGKIKMDDQGYIPQHSGQDANDEATYDQDPNNESFYPQDPDNDLFYPQDPDNDLFYPQDPDNEPFYPQDPDNESYYPQDPAHYPEDTVNQFELDQYPYQMHGGKRYGAVGPDYQQYDPAQGVGNPSFNWDTDPNTNFQSAFGQDQDVQGNDSMGRDDVDDMLENLIESNTNPANQKFSVQETKSHQRGPEGQPPPKAPRLSTERKDRQTKSDEKAPTHEDQSGGRQAALLDESQDLKKDQSENDAIFSGFRELKKTYQKIKADPEKQWTAGFGQELRDAEESQSFLFKIHKIAIGDLTDLSNRTRRSGVDYGLSYSEKAQDLRAYQSRIPTRRDFGDVDDEDTFFKEEGKDRQERDEGILRLGYEYQRPEENDTEESASSEDEAEENSEAEEMDISDSGSQESLDAELGLLDRQVRTMGGYDSDEGFVRDDDEELSISEASSSVDEQWEREQKRKKDGRGRKSKKRKSPADTRRRRKYQIASEEEYVASEEERDSSGVSSQDEGDEDGSE